MDLKKKIGKNKNHPQSLYHINQWKNTGAFDFEMFCYFQPYLLPEHFGPNRRVILLNWQQATEQFITIGIKMKLTNLRESGMTIQFCLTHLIPDLD